MLGLKLNHVSKRGHRRWYRKAICATDYIFSLSEQYLPTRSIRLRCCEIEYISYFSRISYSTMMHKLVDLITDIVRSYCWIYNSVSSTIVQSHKGHSDRVGAYHGDGRFQMKIFYDQRLNFYYYYLVVTFNNRVQHSQHLFEEIVAIGMYFYV